MDTHEYQAKEILKRYGMPIPKFIVVESVDEVEGFDEAVVKIQVHAGGRGKAGGVKIGKDVRGMVSEMLGMKLVNNQTGPAGVIAHKVMVTEPVDFVKEYYLGAIIDRDRAEPILIASPEGGVDIESVPKEQILTVPIRLDGKVARYNLVRFAKFMGWSGETAKLGMQVASSLAKAFIETDSSLLEINPLVETADGGIWALDAKMSIDDNALFRQKEIASFFDASQMPDNEVMAKEYDLAYIALEGNIGCMVNGAGLAMATMDTIHYCGSEPANFLDVGGSADKEKVTAGFKIILADPNVKAILVNIFGGIMNCATIAHGVIAAASELSLKVPLVVRLEGTNVKEGRRLLDESGLDIISAENLADAAKKAVEAAGGRTR